MKLPHIILQPWFIFPLSHRILLPLKFLKAQSCAFNFLQAATHVQRGATQQPGPLSNSLPTATPFCREAESQIIGWDRSPVRRKHYKRNSKRKPKTTPLTPTLKYMALTMAVVSFYTCPNRALPHIILMESSLLTYYLLYSAQIVGDAFRFISEMSFNIRPVSYT